MQNDMSNSEKNNYVISKQVEIVSTLALSEIISNRNKIANCNFCQKIIFYLQPEVLCKHENRMKTKKVYYQTWHKFLSCRTEYETKI